MAAVGLGRSERKSATLLLIGSQPSPDCYRPAVQIPPVNIFLLSSLVKLAIRIIISQLFLKTGCSVAFRKRFKSGGGED